MSDLLLTVTGKHLELTNSTDVLAGEVNATNCVFTFDSVWDDCTKTVVFYSDPTHKKPVILTSNTCPIPWEALLTTGTLQIGLFGVKANMLIPTNYVEHQITEGAHSEYTPPPTEDVYLQIINIMQQQGVDAQTATEMAAEAAASASAAELSEAYAENSRIDAEAARNAVNELHQDIVNNYDTSALAPVVAQHTTKLAELENGGGGISVGTAIKLTPIFTLVDDDTANTIAIGKIKSICDDLGIKATFACITQVLSDASKGVKEALLNYQNEGFNIVSHTTNHTMSELTVANANSDLQKHGFIDYNFLVTPYGVNGEYDVYLAKKYCKALVNAGGSGYYNTATNNNAWHLTRLFIDYTLGLSYYASKIDACYAAGCWIIFGTHSNNAAQFDADFTRLVLTYCIEKGMKNMTLAQAYKLKKPMYDNMDIVESYVSVSVNKSSLTTLLSSARDTLQSIVISATGSDVLNSIYWVTQSDYDAFNGTLSTVKNAYINSFVQSEIDTAYTALSNALSLLNSKKKLGTSNDATGKANLLTAINNANTNLSSTVVSDSASAVSTSVLFVTTEVRAAYENAIATAQAEYNSSTSTTTTVTNAISALATATTVFDNAKQYGTNTGVTKTTLLSTISTASTTKNSVSISVNGSDITNTAYWVTQSVMDTFTSAISTAQGVYDNASATQGEVDSAITALTNAITAFNSAKQLGTYSSVIVYPNNLYKNILNTDLFKGYYVNSSGGLTNTGTNEAYDVGYYAKIPVEAGKTYAVSGNKVGSTVSIFSGQICAAIWDDSSVPLKLYKASADRVLGGTFNGVNYYLVTAPAGATHFVISVQRTSLDQNSYNLMDTLIMVEGSVMDNTTLGVS